LKCINRIRTIRNKKEIEKRQFQAWREAVDRESREKNRLLKLLQEGSENTKVDQRLSFAKAALNGLIASYDTNPEIFCGFDPTGDIKLAFEYADAAIIKINQVD